MRCRSAGAVSAPEVVRKLRRGVWVLQGEIDLHGLRRDEARERVAAFLREAARNGLRCVRVIHGKGNGSPGREPVLKAKVKSWLVQRQRSPRLHPCARVRRRPRRADRSAADRRSRS